MLRLLALRCLLVMLRRLLCLLCMWQQLKRTALLRVERPLQRRTLTLTRVRVDQCSCFHARRRLTRQMVHPKNGVKVWDVYICENSQHFCQPLLQTATEQNWR